MKDNKQIKPKKEKIEPKFVMMLGDSNIVGDYDKKEVIFNYLIKVNAEHGKLKKAFEDERSIHFLLKDLLHIEEQKTKCMREYIDGGYLNLLKEKYKGCK